MTKNEILLNMLMVTDSNMGRLQREGIESLLSYPDLEGDFQRIRHEYPFLGNLEVSRLIILEHGKSKNIMQTLDTAQCVSRIFDIFNTGVYDRWLHSILYNNYYEFWEGYNHSFADMSFKVPEFKGEIPIGNLGIMSDGGGCLIVYGPHGRLGFLRTYRGIDISKDLIGVCVLDDNNIDTRYTVKSSEGRLYMNRKCKGYPRVRDLSEYTFTGTITCCVMLSGRGGW